MRPTRKSQPYRKKAGRPPGSTLSAMLKGSPGHLPNPMDAKRHTAKRKKKRRRKGLASRLRAMRAL